jgi:hypothetical protein
VSAPVERFSKDHRRQERQRLRQLNRLPGPFYDWALRGRWHGLAVELLQGLVVVAVTLAGAKAITGTWLPPFAAVAALALNVAVTALNRSVNARAGR